jgi:hypothetical protein
MRVMLHRHPHICCGPEGHLLDRTSFLAFHSYLEETWLPRLENKFGLEPEDLDRAVSALIDNFFSRYALQREKQRWAEKTPKNILYIDYLLRIFPRAQFIHVIRDPRDVHASVKAKAKTTTPRWSTTTAEQTARSWVRRIQAGLPWRPARERYREVRYEDLVRAPHDVMRDVLRFLGEPWDTRILDPDRREAQAERQPGRGNVRREVFSSSLGRWQHDLTEEEVRHIEVVAAPTMQLLDYEVSRPSVPFEGP